MSDEPTGAITPFDEATYAKGREVLVSVHDIHRVFMRGEEEVHALRGINLNIYRGEYICIMGPSGSDKTTIFNMVGGLDSPTSGRVFIDGVDMAQLNAKELAFLRCRKIGYVFQQFNLNTVMTALENVTLPMVFAGVHPDEARARGMALLEKVGLGQRWNHRPKEMSGGQMQRVAIARSLANNPSILLCDEPTGNLDLKTGKEIHLLLHELNQRDGVTIICATHDPNMLSVSSRMVWIADGRIDRIAVTANVTVEKSSLGSLDSETE